jgi:T-complex protein 1 subunit alpha
VEADAIAVRRVKPEDMRRIAKATGGQVVATMADMEGGETFDDKVLGTCAEVAEERVGDGELLYFRGCKSGAACTVVLRGANEFMLDEVCGCCSTCYLLACIYCSYCVAHLRYCTL